MSQQLIIFVMTPTFTSNLVMKKIGKIPLETLVPLAKSEKSTGAPDRTKSWNL